MSTALQAPCVGQPEGPIWDPLLTTAEAAALLKFSPRTLEKWRSERRGPPFKRFHGAQARYPLSGLKAYLTECQDGLEPGSASYGPCVVSGCEAAQGKGPTT